MTTICDTNTFTDEFGNTILPEYCPSCENSVHPDESDPSTGLCGDCVANGRLCRICKENRLPLWVDQSKPFMCGHCQWLYDVEHDRLDQIRQRWYVWWRRLIRAIRPW